MAAENQVATRAESIIGSLDKKLAGSMAISASEGGMKFTTMAEVLEFAKLLSVSQQAVPPHCRNQPGICLGLTIQAIEWRMSPYAVASKSYVVSDRLCYEAQLIHAVIEMRAPIKGRLRHSYSGDGQKRRCKVWATPKDETEPLVYESPELAKIHPQNSPLWKTKPDLQLHYNTTRDWARMYYPDVILGVYSDDELAAITVDEPGQLRQVSTLNRIADALTIEQAPPDDDDDEHSDDQSTLEGESVHDLDGVDPPHSDEDLKQPTAEQVEQEQATRSELLKMVEAEARAKANAAKAKAAIEATPGGGGSADSPSQETPEERADRLREERKAKKEQGSLL